MVIPLSLQRRVEGLVQEHLDRALLSLDKSGGNTESGSEVAGKANNVNLDEQHDSLLDRSVMEKILQRKSIRMRNFQRSWQVRHASYASYFCNHVWERRGYFESLLQHS